MAIKKIRMRPEGINNYADILHPETSADMVLFPDGSNINEFLPNVATGSFVKSTTSGIYHEVNLGFSPKYIKLFIMTSSSLGSVVSVIEKLSGTSGTFNHMNSQTIQHQYYPDTSMKLELTSTGFKYGGKEQTYPIQYLAIR